MPWPAPVTKATRLARVLMEVSFIWSPGDAIRHYPWADPA
jgi:hypothetical protein